ncbi:MAG: glucosamine-6-phosphate deaminase [Candidatus Aphodomorpha sp.]|nr:glucosamine-6-phosphate deaminase [bacterium]
MKTFQKEELQVKIFDTRAEMGRVAAADFAAVVKELLQTKDTIRIIFAAAPSQDDFLAAAVADKSIDFSRVDAFHMDEYIGLDKDAPQGFGNFLRDRIFAKREFHSVHYLDGQNPDSEAACESYAALLNEKPIDIVCMGIGENGHIAFNDPPVADFNDPKTVKVVKLDEVCRMQQVHDGCFQSIDEVPTHALSLTVPALMAAKYRFCVVPAPTKANAAKAMLNDAIDEHCPCTILRRTPGSILYLDADSSALL